MAPIRARMSFSDEESASTAIASDAAVMSKPLCRGTLKEGMVLAIEPILAAGPGRAFEGDDRWTYRTETGCLAAHYEHTVAVTNNGPWILTQP